MKNNSFIDRYFHSEKELLDIRKKEYRDINTLFSYLNNLHSSSEKLRDNFDCILSKYPEFKVLRILRNYFQHVDDIDELRMYANLKKDMTLSHHELLVIPMQIWAEAVENFIKKNTVSEKRPDYQKKQAFIKKELDSILEICDCVDILNNSSKFCRPLKLNCDNDIVELGFDIYKFVYNISNIIADECRKIDDLTPKLKALAIDQFYTAKNNIPKFNLSSHACDCNNIILTTKGYIHPKLVAPAI